MVIHFNISPIRLNFQRWLDRDGNTALVCIGADALPLEPASCLVSPAGQPTVPLARDDDPGRAIPSHPDSEIAPAD